MGEHTAEAPPLAAASRDASCYDRPNIRTPKAVHVAHPSKRWSSGQPLAGDLDALTLVSQCSGALLDSSLVYRSLADVPQGCRCRRRACAVHWPAA